MQDYPVLQAWTARLMERPAWEITQPTEEALEAFRGRMQKTYGSAGRGLERSPSAPGSIKAEEQGRGGGGWTWDKMPGHQNRYGIVAPAANSPMA